MTTSSRILVTAVIATALCCGGCDVFDKSLYQNVRVADSCLDDLPTHESSEMLFRVDTGELGDDIRSLASCTGQDAPGHDGFFAVRMTAGDKWHFHVRALQGGRNPSVYVLGSACDVRVCQPGDAIDACGEGSDEHLTFVAPFDGVYRVAVDDRNEGGALYDVLALRPECGNGGMPEHSETCDDGNVEPGDGCDDACRAELGAGRSAEVEPNDDPTGANVVLVGAGESRTVTGSIGGRCDFDLFVIDVPAGTSLEATLLDNSGEPCTGSGVPPIALELLGLDGTTVLGDGAVRDGNDCPVIDDMHGFARGLPAGEHFVRVFTDEDQRPFDYRLRLTLVTD